MATRIRYTKYLDGLISKYFKTPDDEVYIKINPDFSFRILNAEGNIAYKGNEKTLQAAKKAAKKVLIVLGASFQAEVRPRTKRIPGC
jgi:hypothetical protein